MIARPPPPSRPGIAYAAQPSPSTADSWCTGLTGTEADKILEALHFAQELSTRRNYRREARAFAVWWIGRGQHPLLAELETVASYWQLASIRCPSESTLSRGLQHSASNLKFDENDYNMQAPCSLLRLLSAPDTLAGDAKGLRYCGLGLPAAA